MIAPRLFVTYKGVEYPIEQRGEAWAIGVADGWYYLSTGEPSAAADRFIRARMRNVLDPPRPAFLASQRYPLLLQIDGVTVRAWAALGPRLSGGAKTYVNPQSGRRISTDDRPIWMFASAGRDASEGGPSTGEQSIADVEALARKWLQKPEPTGR